MVFYRVLRVYGVNTLGAAGIFLRFHLFWLAISLLINQIQYTRHATNHAARVKEKNEMKLYF